MQREDIGNVVLTVNGRRWTRVISLHNAAPDDAVYVLYPKDGSVKFGDGSHGRIPPVGSTVRISYKHGSGNAGNISKRIAKKTDVGKFWLCLRSDRQATGWGRRF